tara:strand:+ start:185 stop:595 length:411 start_codon:yes stop_codon:yes gene_type:complete
MEDDFYATLKLKTGEEVFALVIASEEENRTMLVVHNPVIITAIKAKESIVGYRLEPWLKTTREDMFVINMDNIITLSESMDDEMILMHQNFARETDNISKSKMNRKMGYLSNVKEAKKILEKIYNKEDTKDTNNKS